MPTTPELDHTTALSQSEPHRLSSSTATLHKVFSLRQAATIAGAAYVIQYFTSVWPEFFLRPALIVSGDAVRTASNILAHERLFRLALVSDLIATVAVVVLNAALFQLFAPVNRLLARIAAFLRLVEVSVGSAIAVSGFMVLSLLRRTEVLRPFDQREIEALAYAVIDLRESGYMVLLLLFGSGSTIYMYLLLRSRYVPRPLALVGLVGSALVAPFVLTRLLFPEFVTATFAAARALPAVAQGLIALVLAPLLLFELAFGIWLLVKGIRIEDPSVKIEQEK